MKGWARAEFSAGWRPLLAATIGLGTGLGTVGFVTSVLAPVLIRDNGWRESDFALVTSASLLGIIALPIIGRLTDLFGVRRVAATGLALMPLTYLGFSMSSGSFVNYVAIFMVQAMIGMLTTSTVYTRLVIQAFQVSRGLALAIAASGVAVVGAIGAPLLNDFAEANGWRAAYRVLAIFSAGCGIVTFCLLPPRGAEPIAPLRRAARPARVYRTIFGSGAFWLLLASTVLVNLPQVVVLSQLKLLLVASGIAPTDVGIMFSALSIGTIAGRVLTGVALDSLDPLLVSFACLALPSVGLFIFGTAAEGAAVLTLACFCLGFTYGAEGDIVAYLVSRLFGIEIYSSVLGLIVASMTASAAVGAVLLSWTLSWSGSFDPFVRYTGAGVILGAALLLLLPRGFASRRADVPAG